MVLKILGMGFVLNRGAYLRDAWNILDFVIVTSGYLPLFIASGSGVNLSGLRSLRVLRPLKTVKSVQELRALIVTIFAAIPYLLEIMVVLVFAFLIFAIAGLQLFSGLLQNSCIDEPTGKLYIDVISNTGPFLCTKNSCGERSIVNSAVTNYTKLICAKNNQNPDFNVSNFDDIFSSFLMVYVVTTLEGWTLIMTYVQRSFGYILSLYFLLVVFIGAFFLINLTLAVVTIKFNESQDNIKQEQMLKKKHGTLSVTQLMMISSSSSREADYSNQSLTTATVCHLRV